MITIIADGDELRTATFGVILVERLMVSTSLLFMLALSRYRQGASVYRVLCHQRMMHARGEISRFYERSNLLPAGPPRPPENISWNELLSIDLFPLD